MADALQQSDIDALLDDAQFPALDEWLAARLELSAQDIGTLVVQVGGVLASDMPQEEADDQLVEVLVERARTAEKKFTKKQIDALYPEARELVAGLRSALAEQAAKRPRHRRRHRGSALLQTTTSSIRRASTGRSCARSKICTTTLRACCRRRCRALCARWSTSTRPLLTRRPTPSLS